ncbi:MAG: DNA mismatch endonuclease Vsr [Zoogloeaceae bacterium]|jgi:DNA mismatch endonuclease (patch repair protein)|nr:DNA mismatch endonuclease Vsr [Zoogloeaceae bacterium]
MADIVDSATRSRMMSGIRSKNTSPELFLRKGLHSLGFRYRLHVKELPGKPDMVFPRYGALIEIYGCFWHNHGCRYCKLPATNARRWENKIRENHARDQRNLGALLEAGWRCLVVWECAIRKSRRSPNELDSIQLVTQWLRTGGRFAAIDEGGLHSLKKKLKESHV